MYLAEFDLRHVSFFMISFFFLFLRGDSIFMGDIADARKHTFYESNYLVKSVKTIVD